MTPLTIPMAQSLTHMSVWGGGCAWGRYSDFARLERGRGRSELKPFRAAVTVYTCHT